MTSSPQTSAAIGLRACKGGAVAVAVAMTKGRPQIVLSRSIETSATNDRLSFEPFTVAAELVHGPQGATTAELAALIAEGRRRQGQLAERSLREVIGVLENQHCKVVVAALLVNRAGWISDLLSYSLAWREHVPVAETLAVRDALRGACSACGLAIVELDEKTLPDRASQMFEMPAGEIAALLKGFGSVVGRPWRKEQKLSCLAGWVGVGGRG
jgi:hypothetical protein